MPTPKRPLELKSNRFFERPTFCMRAMSSFVSGLSQQTYNDGPCSDDVRASTTRSVPKVSSWMKNASDSAPASSAFCTNSLTKSALSPYSWRSCMTWLTRSASWPNASPSTSARGRPAAPPSGGGEPPAMAPSMVMPSPPSSHCRMSSARTEVQPNILPSSALILGCSLAMLPCCHGASSMYTVETRSIESVVVGTMMHAGRSSWARILPASSIASVTAKSTLPVSACAQSVSASTRAAGSFGTLHVSANILMVWSMGFTMPMAGLSERWLCCALKAVRFAGNKAAPDSSSGGKQGINGMPFKRGWSTSVGLDNFGMRGTNAWKASRKCSRASRETQGGFLAPPSAARSARVRTCSTKMSGSAFTSRPGMSSCSVGVTSTHKEGATAQMSLRAEGGKSSLRAENSLAVASASGSVVGAVAGTQASVFSFSSASALPPVSCAWFLSRCAKSLPARPKSLSATTASASSTASSQEMSRLMPQVRSTRQTTSDLRPASVTDGPIFARRCRTRPKDSGLSSGSKQALTSCTVPSSVGIHLNVASWLPNSLISVSFKEPAHSKKASKNLVFSASSRSFATGSTTSERTLLGAREAKTARRCSTQSLKGRGVFAFASDMAVRARTCSTRTLISDAIFLPGCNSCNVGTVSTAREGATAQTSLRSEGGKTDFKGKNCVASLASASKEGAVAGTQAMLCSFSRAGARSPASFAWFLSRCEIRCPARSKSLSRTTASASSTASAQVSSVFIPHRRHTRQTTSLLKSDSLSMVLSCARPSLTMLKASGLVSGSKQSLMALGFPSLPGIQATADN
mmetsp:Transcript_8434/g.23272  ORF Transcript_8434/g.23272 Transcript_8434/m.23272 type:complete len:804 (+) Transcript_8434:682-3093(+)